MTGFQKKLLLFFFNYIWRKLANWLIGGTVVGSEIRRKPTWDVLKKTRRK